MALAAPLCAQYAGPAVLTRGEAPAAMTEATVSFRPFVEAVGIYDTGLAAVAVNERGDLANAESFGTEIAAGISGSHNWRRTKLGLDYRGALRHYSKTTYYDGSDHSLLLGVSHQLTRHTMLTLRQSAGMFSRGFGLLGMPQTVPFDPATTFIPTSDFYDNRTIYLSSQADYTIQRSTRLSFNLGGDGFLARRRSSALYGVSGGGARADVQYRVSRRSTLGAAYNYTHFGYRGVFSGTDLHSAVGSYAIRLTRHVEFTGFAGVVRAETNFVQSVPLDPAVAALIGVREGAVIVHRVDYLPNVSARLSRTFEHSVAYASGGHAVTPGNGLFLTSAMTSISAGYTYTGLRNWSFNTQADYSRGDSIGNITGRYGSYSGSVSASRQIGRSLHLIGSFYARQYDSPDFQKYNRLIYTARLGLGFTPGDIPLRLW